MGILAPAADERVANIDFTDEQMSVELKDGRTISVPLHWYPRLLHATPEQRRNWEVATGGYHIHWPEADEDLSTEGLLLGLPAAKGSIPIARKPITSGVLSEIGYNQETQMLEVQFRANGEVYRCLGVPEEEYLRLLKASLENADVKQQLAKAGHHCLRIG